MVIRWRCGPGQCADIAAARATGPILAAKVNAGSLKVIGATVSLSTGKVELVPDGQQ